MISFDLKCLHGHVFEGWFRSSTDFIDQRGRRLIACPACGNAEIEKAVMAPAVAAKGNRRGEGAADSPTPTVNDGGGDEAQRMKALLAAMAQAQTEALKSSEWVGDQFAERARAMYYGEAEAAQIHGTTNAADARAMMEEGVPVAPLIVPVARPENTH